MGHVHFLDLGDPAQARDLRDDLLEFAAVDEHAVPGLRIVGIRHVVVGMVARHHHQGTQHHRAVSGFGHRRDDRLAGRLLRLAFHRPDEHVLIAQRRHLRLHLAVGDLRRVRGAVAHEHKRHALLRRLLQAPVLAVLQSRRHDRLRDRCLVLVDVFRVLAHFAQQRLRDPNALKFALVRRHGLRQLVVLRTVHQVRRLDHQVLHPAGHRTLQRLLHVVDRLAVAGQHMVDDDLGGKGTPHAPVGIGFRQRVLDALDVQSPALVEGGAEAHHQQLVLADLVGVPGIVLRSVAGVTAEVIRLFHQLLLLRSQRVPGLLGRRAHLRRVVCPLLDLDRSDQFVHRRRGVLVVGRQRLDGTERYDQQQSQRHGEDLAHFLHSDLPSFFKY